MTTEQSGELPAHTLQKLADTANEVRRNALGRFWVDLMSAKAGERVRGLEGVKVDDEMLYKATKLLFGPLG